MRIRKTEWKKQVGWNKYNAKRTKCLSGHYHPSQLEANHCNYLFAQKQNGEIYDYEIQKRFDLIVNGVKICTHIVDFYIEELNEVHETKGMETDLFNIKRKLFEICYPDITYILIK